MRHICGMSKTDDAIARIKAFAAYKGWSKTQLAAESGLRDTTLRNFHLPTWNPTRKTMNKIERIIPVEFGLDLVGAFAVSAVTPPRPPALAPDEDPLPRNA